MSKLDPIGGFRGSPRPANNSSQTVYGAGTAYSLTQTPALLNLGTTPVSIVLANPGTYLLMARAVLEYNGATFAASRVVTLKLRRTNNTAADLANSSMAVNTAIVTTITNTFGDFVLPVVIYTTQNSNDIIQIFGDVGTVPTAGSLDAVAGEIVAIRIS